MLLRGSAAGTTSLLGKTNGMYTFVSKPRPILQNTTASFHNTNNDENGPYKNVIRDRRIFRGNAYSFRTLSAKVDDNGVKQSDTRKRYYSHKRNRREKPNRSPPPLNDRRHLQIQTDVYVDQIVERGKDVGSQTDSTLDDSHLTVSNSPEVPTVHVATQIYDGDLFDFDVEVQPVVESLVSMTMEQALLEVIEEEEINLIRRKQVRYAEFIKREMVEKQRLLEQNQKYLKAKEERINQEKIMLDMEAEDGKKESFHLIARSFLVDLIPSVYSNLLNFGYLEEDPVRNDIKVDFLPWLMNQVSKQLDELNIDRDSVINAASNEVPTFKENEQEDSSEKRDVSLLVIGHLPSD